MNSGTTNTDRVIPSLANRTLLHLNGFESCATKKRHHPNGWGGLRFVPYGRRQQPLDLHLRCWRKLRLRSVEPSRATVHRTVAFRWVRVRCPAITKRTAPRWGAVLFVGGHILVKFELRIDSICCRVKVSLPSL